MSEKTKKVMFRVVVVILALILLVFIISLIVKHHKANGNIEKKVSYPSEAKYVGFVSLDDGSYELDILNDEFKRIGDSVKVPNKIKDYTVKKERLLLFTNSLNEVYYSAAKKQFYLKEKNDYISNADEVKIYKNNLYEVVDNTLYSVDLKKQEKKSILYGIDTLYDIKDGNIYYKDNVGMEEYNILSEEKVTIIANEKNMSLMDYNDNFYLFKIGNSYKFYNIEENEVKLVSDFLIITPKILGLYKGGFLYIYDGILYNYNIFAHGSSETGYSTTVPIDKSIIFDDYLYTENYLNNKIISLDTGKIITKLARSYDEIVKLK